MIFLYQARLVILSQPKTGTTALDNALAPRASVVVSNPPGMKHIGYRRFMKFVAPWFEGQAGLARRDYEVVSVMREPIDWLGSWYRYRTRAGLQQKQHERAGNYTGDISFDQFVLGVAEPKGMQPTYAQVGSPCGIALDSNKSVGVDRLFPYEDLSGLYELIESRTGKPVATKQVNVSPEIKLELSDETSAKIRKKLAFAFEVHASLKRDGTVDPRFRRTDDWDEDGDEG